ncbi:hypothetical protein PBAL39_12538 [Pedobacter sp. BAL39]|nr:hypothetical protein PBAL39_12538 [Pedobacter sp. BAL39]
MIGLVKSSQKIEKRIAEPTKMNNMLFRMRKKARGYKPTCKCFLLQKNIWEGE